MNDTTSNRQLLFGVAVSVKLFKKASDRNRVKRVIRESYRLQKKTLADKLKETEKGLYLFFIYTGKQLPVFDEMMVQTAKALDKLCKIVAE